MALHRYSKEHPEQPDYVTGALVTIDTDHQSIHRGGMYGLTEYDAAVVNNGTFSIGFEIPAGLRVAVKHLECLGFGWYFKLVVVPFTTYTESGTFLTPTNHNVSTDSPASLVKVNLNPTDLPVTEPMKFIFGGGTGVAATGSSSSGQLDDEYGFSAGKHVVICTNLSGETSLIQLRFTWIERYTY